LDSGQHVHHINIHFRIPQKHGTAAAKRLTLLSPPGQQPSQQIQRIALLISDEFILLTLQFGLINLLLHPRTML